MKPVPTVVGDAEVTTEVECRETALEKNLPV